MKTLKNILYIGTAALMLAACDTDIDEVRLAGQEGFVAPVINGVGNVIVNADNSDAETVVFSWSKADFGAPVQVQYTLYVTYDGQSAAVGSTTQTMLAVTKGDLNGVVMNELGVAANQTAAVTAYVEASVFGTDQYAPIASAASPSFEVTTFAAALKWLFCCGNFTGGWDIDNAPILYETKGGSNTYSAMMDFNDGGGALSYFKITAAQNWSEANWGFNYLTPGWGNLDPDQGDSNLSIDISGQTIWAVTVKTSVMTIDAEPVGNTLSLIGDYNGWAGDDLFTFDYATASWVTDEITFSDGDGIKVRVDGDWAVNWGMTGKASSAIAGGYELDRGADNIPAPAGAHRVRLYTNRTPYVLVIE